MKEKEALLLKHLRENSRKSLSEISKETGIPISTLFETLKRLENTIISKHISLLNFPSLGYNTRVHMVIHSKNKHQLKEFLKLSKNVNSLCSIANKSGFYADCIFVDLKQMIEFKENLEAFGAESIYETFIVDELKREGFIL